jgi:hypothetical protein
MVMVFARPGSRKGAPGELGLHPVLVNAFARAMGHQRDDYAKMLADLEREPEVTPRWRSS